jgi:hypothetical protein
MASSFFCDPAELPSQKLTTVVAFAPATPTNTLSIVSFFRKKAIPSATTNVRSAKTETVSGLH